MAGPAADPLASITRVVTRSAAAQVADQLVLAVREQRLTRGDRLPSERDLAERFGVSRPTVREALAALELAGIVRSHKGKGTLVEANASHVATWGVEVLPPQIFEARLTIEPVLAMLAAEKRYPEDIARLEAAAAELQAEFAATSTYGDDLSVHRAIARAARNPILERALEDALVHMRSPLWTDLSVRALVAPGARKGHVAESQRVTAAIKEGNAAKAGEVWRQHLIGFRNEMLGRADDSADGTPPGPAIVE